MGDVEFVCAKEFMSMWCCASGYTNITWSRKIKGASNWENYPWSEASAYTDTEDQVGL
jgi:hypothetical protein